MRILERIADTIFPLMLFAPIYFIFLLSGYRELISIFGAFIGSVALMFLASDIDSRLHRRRLRRKLEDFYK